MMVADHGIDVLVANWIAELVASVFIVLRVYCKVSKQKSLWWDDCFLVLSWLFLTASVICDTMAVSVGFGEHSANVPLKNLKSLSLLGNLFSTFSVIATAWSKTSFGLTLVRLCVDRWSEVFVWLIIIFINVVMFPRGLILWWQCNFGAPTGGCIPRDVYKNYAIFSTAFSGAMDIFLALLPWIIVRGLRHIGRAERFGIALAMSMGVFAAITAVVRCTLLKYMVSNDFNYDGVWLSIWATFEPAVTIIAASIPVLRPLIHNKFFSRPAAATPSQMQSFWRRSKALGGTWTDPDESAGTSRRRNETNTDSILILQSFESSDQKSIVLAESESRSDRGSTHSVLGGSWNLREGRPHEDAI